MKPKGALVLWKFKFCAKNHLVKVGTLNWCIKHTVYIHKGTVQRHLWLIEGVYLPLRGKEGVFSIKKFASVSLYMAKRDIKALWAAHHIVSQISNPNPEYWMRIVFLINQIESCLLLKNYISIKIVNLVVCIYLHYTMCFSS